MMLNNEGDANRVSKETSEILTLFKQYMKLEAIDKLSVATTFLIAGGVILVLAVSAVYFLSMGLVKTISVWIGSEAGAYYLMGGILFLLIIIFYINRKAWVENPVVRRISQSMLKEEDDDEEA